MQTNVSVTADLAAEATMKKRNTLTIGDQLKSYARHPGAGVLAFLTLLGAVITFALLFFLIGYVLVKGIPYLNASLFSLTYTSENVSLLPSLINTLIMTLVSLAIAAPVGIFAAIFLVEYAKKGSRFVKLIRITAETLSGIPSIVYGLFGMLFFVTALHWGMSLLSGALTMVIMVLPLIMRTAEEALKSVPDSYREASFGLGAGKLRTIFTIVLPSAVPGILAGVILGIGIGMVFLGQGTTGGTDMMAALIQKYMRHYSIAQIMQFIDGLIVIVGMYVFGIQRALYAIIAVYLVTKVSDSLIEGLKFSKQTFIITEKPDEVARVIMEDLDRGATGICGKGMYSGQEKTIIFCVVNKKEIVKLKELVDDIDPNAFVIVSDAREVHGEGFIEKK